MNSIETIEESLESIVDYIDVSKQELVIVKETLDRYRQRNTDTSKEIEELEYHIKSLEGRLEVPNESELAISNKILEKTIVIQQEEINRIQSENGQLKFAKEGLRRELGLANRKLKEVTKLEKEVEELQKEIEIANKNIIDLKRTKDMFQFTIKLKEEIIVDLQHELELSSYRQSEDLES